MFIRCHTTRSGCMYDLEKNEKKGKQLNPSLSTTIFLNSVYPTARVYPFLYIVICLPFISFSLGSTSFNHSASLSRVDLSEIFFTVKFRPIQFSQSSTVSMFQVHFHIICIFCLFPSPFPLSIFSFQVLLLAEYFGCSLLLSVWRI